MNKTKDLQVHVFLTGDLFWYGKERIDLEKMKKFRINHLMVTIMSMERQRLITKEQRDRYYLGERIDLKGSINDSIETLLEDIRLGHLPNEIFRLYFTPRLTEKEMQLIERKDPAYWQTFSKWSPDVGERSMKNSESDSKFCYTFCQRETKSYHLSVHKNGKSPNDRIFIAPPVPKKIKFN